MGLWKVTRIEAFQAVTSETSDSNTGDQVCEANTVRRVPVTLIQTEGKGRPLQQGCRMVTHKHRAGSCCIPAAKLMGERMGLPL